MVMDTPVDPAVGAAPGSMFRLTPVTPVYDSADVPAMKLPVACTVPGAMNVVGIPSVGLPAMPSPAPTEISFALPTIVRAEVELAPSRTMIPVPDGVSPLIELLSAASAAARTLASLLIAFDNTRSAAARTLASFEMALLRAASAADLVAASAEIELDSALSAAIRALDVGET